MAGGQWSAVERVVDEGNPDAQSWVGTRRVRLGSLRRALSVASGGVTDFAELFCADETYCSYTNAGAASFNDDITGWDTGAGTSMGVGTRCGCGKWNRERDETQK